MVARADAVADHAHRRDRGEAGHPVRAPGLDCVHLRRGDDLDRLVPGGTDESALAARADVALPQVRRGHELGPGGHRVVVVARLGRAEHLQQHAAHVGVADPGGRVGVPGERGAPRAAARLVLGAVRADRRVVGLLCLPGDDVVLDVDLPGARAGAVHAVCRAHDLVVATSGPDRRSRRRARPPSSGCAGRPTPGPDRRCRPARRSASVSGSSKPGEGRSLIASPPLGAAGGWFQ